MLKQHSFQHNSRHRRLHGKLAGKLDGIIQYLIPPSLLLLMVLTIWELFYGVGAFMRRLIEIFDIYVIVIFATDLYYRWREIPKVYGSSRIWPYLKRHWLDIIATVPFNLILGGVEALVLLRSLRGIRIIGRAARAFRLLRAARYARLLRLLRFAARAPRFIRMRKHLKKAQIRKVQPHEKELPHTLDFRVILLITINSIMGTGIWFLTAAGAKHAGPASLLSWGILALISVYIAMCFGELAAMFPKAGGVYEFAKQAYGRFWSFVIGWTTSIAGSVTIAMLLLGSLQYLIPLQYSHFYIPLAIALILVFNYVAYRGMQTSVYVLVAFALITLLTITAILLPGFLGLNLGNFRPFFVFPGLSIILTIFFIAETFFGWESAIFLSAETKNPTKIMPRALVYGTIAIAVLAFSLAATSMGVIPWQQYAASTTPLSDLGEVHFGMPGRTIFTILVFVAIIGAVASWVVTAPRLLMAIAEDKLFFVQFSRIHPRYKSPYVSIAFQVLAISALVVIGSGNYETLLHMLIPLIFVVYSAVLLSVIILRYRRPELPRPYKVIFGRSGPLLTILFMVFLLVMFIRETQGALDILRISAGLIAFGIPAYFFIELFYDEKYVRLRRDAVARMSHHLHRIPLPKPAFSRILRMVGPLSSKSDIMVFNSFTGAFTSRLLKGHIPFHRVHVANESSEELAVFRERLQESGFPGRQVSTHYLRALSIPAIPGGINAFISFNDLGYVKNLPEFLAQLRRVLQPGGKYCFYLRHHLLNVTPNAVIVEDREKILALFRQAGLEAR